jgi:hypothetical protein
MKRIFLFLLALASFTIVLHPSPASAETPKTSVKKSSAQKASPAEIAASANGWTYVNGEWIHPDGYKFVKNQLLRTTAKAGNIAPKPPGKLALENPQSLTPKTKATTTKTPAETAAEARKKNLAPSAAPRTGTHL